MAFQEVGFSLEARSHGGHATDGGGIHLGGAEVVQTLQGGNLRDWAILVSLKAPN